MKNLNRLLIAGICVLLLAGTFVSCRRVPDLGEGLFARINTNRGDIFIQLAFEEIPLAVTNFVALAEGTMDVTQGRPFFNGMVFFGGTEGVLIRAGCLYGTGFSEVGYFFPNEFHPDISHNFPGVIGVTHLERDKNNSQFYITMVETPWLDGTFTAFGRVVAGLDVVRSLERNDRIRRVTIIRNGPAANEFTANQAAFDALLLEVTAGIDARDQAIRKANIARIYEMFPDAVISPLGVWYVIHEEGTGDRAPPGGFVRIFYLTRLLSGALVGGVQAPRPAARVPVGVGSVVRGIDEMLLDMRPGERRSIVIPPELGYGDRWIGGNLIPPNSFLVTEIELVNIQIDERF